MIMYLVNFFMKIKDENQGWQLSCYNSIVEGMKFLLENENVKNDDIVIFSHEDCYINNLFLFNKNLPTDYEKYLNNFIYF